MLLHRISSYNCRGNYSFLNSSSEETIQGEETNQGRKLYEEIRYSFHKLNQKVENKLSSTVPCLQPGQIDFRPSKA